MTAPRRTLLDRLAPLAVFVLAVVIVFGVWAGQMSLSGWIIWGCAIVIILSVVATERDATARGHVDEMTAEFRLLSRDEEHPDTGAQASAASRRGLMSFTR